MEVIFRLVNMQLLNQGNKSSQEATASNDGIFYTLPQSGTNKESSGFQTEKSNQEQKRNLNVSSWMVLPL